MFENLAAKYLASLTPQQISEGLPRWLEGLSDLQFAAALDVAYRERQRRSQQTLQVLESIAAGRRKT